MRTFAVFAWVLALGFASGAGVAPAQAQEDQPFAGIKVKELTAEEAAARKVDPGTPYVARVEAGSPADKAGLKVDDLVLAANGTGVASVQTLLPIFAALKPGDTFVLTVARAGQSVEARVKLISKRQWEEMLGEPAPELAAEAWVGEAAPLAQLKGRVVVLFFFSILEPPSQEFHNQIELWCDQFKGKPVRWVGAQTPTTNPAEQGVEQVKAFVAAKKCSYPVAISKLIDATTPPRFWTDYRLSGLPTVVVVDAEGIIRYKSNGRPNLVEIEKGIAACVEKVAGSGGGGGGK